MATLQEAREIAKESYSVSRKTNRVAQMRCKRCFDVWKKNGEKPEDKPPMFACDYEGSCPVCGEQLSNSYGF